MSLVVLRHWRVLRKQNKPPHYVLMWVRGATAVCCARVVLAFNALNALGRCVAYELQFTSFARSEGKEKAISLKCAIVRPRCFTLWVKCQCIVGEGVTSLLSVAAFVDVVGKEVLLILGKLHVVGACAASLRLPCADNWACFFVFAAVASARHKR